MFLNHQVLNEDNQEKINKRLKQRFGTQNARSQSLLIEGKNYASIGIAVKTLKNSSSTIRRRLQNQSLYNG